MIVTVLTTIVVLICGTRTSEAFRAPVVNLRCEAGAALPGHLVNVTWQTDDNQLPDDVISRLQNCQASIDCTTGYRRYSGCPYFTSTGLNGGWEFRVPDSETSCAVTVSIVDVYDVFSTLQSTTERCNFSITKLTVDVSTKDSVHVLECNATTVRGVTSTATFVWKSNDQEVDRANVSGTAIDNSMVYTHTHNTHGEETVTSNGIATYECYVELNTKSKVYATGEIAINYTTTTENPTQFPTSDKPTNITTDSDTPTEDEVTTTVTSPFCTSPNDKKALPEIFKDPPILNLTCTQQHINVTWIPVECYRPTEVEDRLQNCQASIKFGNGNWINRGCPYFSSTGLNGGWQWDIGQSVNETLYTVKVSFVDTHDPYSSLLTQTASCNIITSETTEEKRAVPIKNVLAYY